MTSTGSGIVTLYRIAQDAPAFEAHDMLGIGARLSGGRWNSAGRAVVYTSPTRALACLESIVHSSGAHGLPLNRYLVEVDVPQPLWDARVTYPDPMEVGWDATPPGMVSQRWGDTWLRLLDSALAVVPSVVVPEERNVLINPDHPEATAIRARKVRRWLFDARFPVRSSM